MLTRQGQIVQCHLMQTAQATEGETKMTETMPKGKKTLRRTVRGSLCGYIGGKFWINFGEVFEAGVQARADDWLNE
jgi:hypothetical protein